MIKIFNYLNNLHPLVGFLASITFLALYHIGHYLFGYTIAIAWMQLFLIGGGLLSGFRFSLLLATIVSIYTYIAISDDPSRVVQIIIVSILMALITGAYSYYQRWTSQQALINQLIASEAKALALKNEAAAEMLTELNGNIANIKSVRLNLKNILTTFDLPPEVDKSLNDIVHLLGNLELAASGWRALDKIRTQVKEAKGQIAGEMWRKDTLG